MSRLWSPRWRLLALGVAAAVVFSGVWLWAAAGDRVTAYRVQPAGETFAVADTTWRVESMVVGTEFVPGYGDTERPPSGAVYVFVTVAYDATALPGDAELLCGFELTEAAELSWDEDTGFLPADPGLEYSCTAGAAGRVQARYTVPERLLERIVGVEVSVFLDSRHLTSDPVVVLAGTLSR